MQPEVRIRRLSPSWDSEEGRAFCLRLNDFCAELPAETVIEGRRNLLHRVRVSLAGGQEIVIKIFPACHRASRLVYTLRSSKALRSYDIAVRLLELGVSTPEPLAAVETWRGLLAEASYCCRWHAHWSRARELKVDLDPRAEQVTWALGVFVGRLHNIGVLHRDLTAGNILIGGDPATPLGVSFSLVDLNRIHFTFIGRRMGLANLAQLGRFPFMAQLLDGYCQERGLSSRWSGPRFGVLLGARRLLREIHGATRPARRALGL